MSPISKISISSSNQIFLVKVYDTNELSYIIKGKMEIIPQATGQPILVQAGDFVTFPDGFACYWYVIEPVVKHWYLYDYVPPTLNRDW